MDHWASQVAQWVKKLPAMQETQVQSLDWADPLEEGKATCSSILDWRIPWTEEPGEQSMGSQRVGHDWSDWACVYRWTTRNLNLNIPILCFPGGSDGKASACNAGDLGSIPGSGSSSGEGNDNPLHLPFPSSLENPMDGGAFLFFLSFYSYSVAHVRLWIHLGSFWLSTVLWGGRGKSSLKIQCWILRKVLEGFWERPSSPQLCIPCPHYSDTWLF